MNILVLMSTYNGEKYLKEQINSVLAQDEVDVHLLIRDDGSEDDTCAILDKYRKKYFDKISVVKGENVGFVKSFSSLINIAVSEFGDYDYYAFSDQDDIWLPNKLRIACDFLSKKNSNLPNLFTSNSSFVDSNKNHLGLFHSGECPQYTMGNVLLYSTEQGCSMVFNRKAADIYSKHNPQKSWHDRWMYDICFFMGSVSYYHKPLFLYRIHSRNALGSNVSKLRMPSLKEIISPNSVHLTMAQEFYDCFNEELDVASKTVFERYISYKRNIGNKVLLLFSAVFAYPESNWKKIIIAKTRILFNRA